MTKKKDKNKNKKKIIIISVAAVVVVIAAAILGFFIYQNKEKNKSVGSDWGDTYYSYLKEALEEGANLEDYGLDEDMENIELQFIDTDEANPVMVMSYEKDDNNYVNFYRAKNSEKVDKIIYEEPSTVQFLYNIESKEYNWYVHVTDNEKDLYKTVNKILENPKGEVEPDYTIKKDEATTQKTLKGDTITLPKFDEIFVEVDTDQDSIDFSLSMNADEFKDEMTEGVKDYKDEDTIVTEKVEENVAKKVEELENTKKAIETAKEEIKKDEERKAAEAEKKRQEELARGLKIGSYTLKYGKYVSDVNKMDSSMYGTLILRPNGKFHITANCEGSYPYKKLNEDGTYVQKTIQNSFSYQQGLEFTTNSGVKFSLIANSNGFNDQWHGYSYVGAE